MTSLWLVLVVLAGSLQVAWAAPKHSQSCDEQKECRAVNDEAVSLFAQRRYQEALDKFQAAYAMAPSANLLLSIGRTLFRLKDYSGSIAYLTRYKNTLQAADPQLTAKLTRYLTEAQEALQRFTTAREQGLAALAEGRYEDALAALKTAEELRPDPELTLAQGRALQALQRHREAISAYLSYLQAVGPEHPKRSEVARLLTESEAALEQSRAATTPTVPPTMPPTVPPSDAQTGQVSPSVMATPTCLGDPRCAGQPAAPPLLLPVPRSHAPIEPDRDLEESGVSPAARKPLYKSAGLWVGVSVLGAAVIAAIITGVYVSRPSSPTLYSVSWQ